MRMNGKHCDYVAVALMTVQKNCLSEEDIESHLENDKITTELKVFFSIAPAIALVVDKKEIGPKKWHNRQWN